MKKMEAVVATTHIDAHQEQISLEGLESMAEKMSEYYIPFVVEHDPRIPPIGRVNSAQIRSRTDGEHELVAEVELFEQGDKPPLQGASKRLAIPKHDVGGLTVSFDRTYRFGEDQADISEIARLFSNPPIEECKKSLDPISVIRIAGIFAISSIAAGFFGQIGADGWNTLKGRLSNLFKRKANRAKGQLLILNAIIRDGSSDPFEVQLILTDPTEDDITQSFPKALRLIDRTLPFYRRSCPEAGRFVFELKDGDAELMYLIRVDCLPLFANMRTREILSQLDNEPPTGREDT